MERPPEMKDLARPVTRDVGRPEQIQQSLQVHPLVDILDRPEEIVVHADMPGVAPDGIDARYENGILILSGRLKPPSSEAKEALFREFVRADYYREFSVGEDIEQEGITAEYDAGVLTVSLPKSKSRHPRRIEVKRKAGEREEP